MSDGSSVVGSEIVTGHVETAVHGRYLLRAAPVAHTAPLIVGFHGYGENASAILEALIQIPGIVGWHVASVQALHPFYNRRTGEVVASWMTKQDREQTIADNVAYVARTVLAIGERVPVAGPTVYAGFSQGTAMTYRAAAHASEACAGVIALAGDVPPELAGEASWGRPPVLIGRGTGDEWYNEAKWEHDESLLTSLGSEVETCVFEGGHEWTGTFRRRAGSFLERLLS